MPGIVGLVQQQGHIPSPSPIKKMLRTLHLDHTQATQYIDQNKTLEIGQVTLDTNPPPTYHSDQSVSIFLFGEIYHGLEGATSFNDKNIIALIAGAYLKCGINFVDKLIGEFLIIIHDYRENFLYLVNDRYGRRPTYYAHSEGRLLFSSEIKAILAYPFFKPQIDIEAIADFMAFGYILGERTLLQNISMLPPASVYKYDINTGITSATRYWDIRNILVPYENPDNNLVDQISDTFKKAVERRLSTSDTNWISLSGGMDSRAIAAVVDPEIYPIKTVTSGISGGYERRITSNIATVVGCDHFFYELDEQILAHSIDGMAELIKEAIALTDGMRGTSSGAMTAFSARSRRSYGLKAVLTGHGGEIAKLDDAYGLAIRSHHDEQLISNNPVDWLFKRMMRSNAPQVNQANLYKGTLADIFHEAPKDHISSIISRLNPDTPPAQIISFFFLNELFRKRALYALMVHRAYADIRIPFYDDELLDLIVRAPLSLRSNYKIHGHIIRKNKPELLNIVLSDSRSRPFSRKPEKILRQLPFKVGRKLGLFKRDFPEDYFAAHTDTQFFQRILLDPATLDRGYVNPQAIKGLLSQHQAGQNSLYTLLHLLTIIELWHRDYMDNL